jgi:hypothetical protein
VPPFYIYCIIRKKKEEGKEKKVRWGIGSREREKRRSRSGDSHFFLFFSGKSGILLLYEFIKPTTQNKKKAGNFKSFNRNL